MASVGKGICGCLESTAQMALLIKNPPTNAGDVRDAGSILGREDPLEKEVAAHSRILAWRIPWTEEPGGPQAMGSQRVTETIVL